MKQQKGNQPGTTAMPTQPETITVAVPAQRVFWLRRELDKAGIPYQVDEQRTGNAYNVHTLPQAATMIDGIVSYRPQKKSSGGGIKGFFQKQIYFVEEMIVFFVLLVALLGGVYLFGLGNLDPTFALLYGDKGTGNPFIVLRAVALLVIAIFVLLFLKKTVGKPPDGMPRGTVAYRFLSVLLIGGLVVALLAAWGGWL